jgi:hypothetical protein
VSRVYLLVLVEDAFDFFGDLMPRSATESSRALLSRRGPGRCRGSAADPRRRRHERPRPSEATATHAAIVKPGTPDRSRRRARRAICGTAGRRTFGPPRGIGRRGRRAQARKTLSLIVHRALPLMSGFEKRVSYGGPRVRILLPPPASLLRTLTSSIRAPNLSSARASWLRNANNDEEAAMERKKREGYF